MRDLAEALLDYLSHHYRKLPQPWWATPIAYEVLLAGQWTLERLVIRRHVAGGAPRPPARPAAWWLGPLCWLVLQVPAVRAGNWWKPFHGLTVPFVGMAIAMGGGALRLWALSHLRGKFSYSTRAVRDSQLVTTGPYRWVRHPLYTGILLYFTGLPLVLPELSSCCAMVLITATAIAIRIRKEEREMRERHGAEFEAYLARTRLLFPGLL